MINQSGRSITDTPLVGETEFSKTFLILGMILCAVVHFIFLDLVGNALVDILVYLFLCLLLIPIAFVLYIAPTERSHTYYLTGELSARRDQMLSIGIMAVVTFALSFLISLASVEELINLYGGDVKNIPLPINQDKTPYMAMLYLVFVIAMPIAEEGFWRVFLPKSFSVSLESTFLIALLYGFMNLTIVFSIFHKWEYGLIGFIYSILVHFIFGYIHKHTRFLGLAIVSFAMRLGFALSMHFFLFAKLSSDETGNSSQIPFTPSIKHHHN